MWIQVRTFDASRKCRIDGLSKLTTVEEVRRRIPQEMEGDDDELLPERLRLFFKGKELIDEHTLYDYDVGLDAVLQLLIRKPIVEVNNNNEAEKEDKETNDKDSGCESEPSQTIEEKDIEDATYKVGEYLDVIDKLTGAWFEAKIVEVKGVPAPQTPSSDPSPHCPSEDSLPVPPHYKDDGFSYKIQWLGYDDQVEVVSSIRLRPIARTQLKLKDLKVDETYMVNVNTENPEDRGFYYDMSITKLPANKARGAAAAEIYGYAFVGADRSPIPVQIKFGHFGAIYALEHPDTSKRVFEDGEVDPTPREVGEICQECKGKNTRKCKKCGCAKCGGKDKPEMCIICDECDDGFHLWCLVPPLAEMPTDEHWYCPDCRTDDSKIVKAGEALKMSKKKSSMPSAKGEQKRDWGRGMATQGIAKKCTIVDGSHFGPIPGVEVGQSWLYRVDCASSGVHRPPVAGISGQGNVGAQSIVLAGGYEDDEDRGDEFTYTGAGGRDLSGNKRTADQSMAQQLTLTNLALARNCAAFNEKTKLNGGDAKEKWQAGKALRVVRSWKGRKHDKNNKYAPEEEMGLRYDGIYKVVKYWQEKGKSGHEVWKYLMRRDDETPAPWTKEGKRRMQELGLETIKPSGYEEKLAEKERKKEEKEKEKKERRKSKMTEDEEEQPKKRKRRISSDESEDEDFQRKKARKSEGKKADSVTVLAFSLPTDLAALVDADTLNAKMWEEIKAECLKGRPKFIEKMKDMFECVCCQDVVFRPVTTNCGHNTCQSCLKRSFASGAKSCPFCRAELTEADLKKVNDGLGTVLKTLLPGYEIGRD